MQTAILRAKILKTLIREKDGMATYVSTITATAATEAWQI